MARSLARARLRDLAGCDTRRPCGVKEVYDVRRRRGAAPRRGSAALSPSWRRRSVTQLPEALRDARPVASSELRERVRLIAAPELEPRRSLSWSRLSLVAVAAALAAAAVAGVVIGLHSRTS